MRIISLAAVSAMLVPLTIGAQEIDPANVSTDKYRVLFENDHARVVEYLIKPGEKDLPHTHPAKVSYVVAGGSLRIFPEGAPSFDTEETAGDATFRGPVRRHYVENTGTTPVDIVLVEIKKVDGSAPLPDKDPALVNPSSISVKLENDSVRVMVAELPPGFKEKLHTHPPYVMYILSGGNVRMHIADGTTRDAELKTGMALFSDSVTHWAENTGSTTIRVLLVELRHKK